MLLLLLLLASIDDDMLLLNKCVCVFDDADTDDDVTIAFIAFAADVVAISTYILLK